MEPIVCYQCNHVGYIRPDCLELKHVCLNRSEQEDKIIGWNIARDKQVINSGDIENELSMIYLYVNVKNVRAVIDTSAQVTAFPTRDILEGEKRRKIFFFILALGRKQKPNLVSIPILLIEGNKIYTEKNVVVVVIKNLNCPPLILPAVYTLLKQENLDSWTEAYKRLENHSELSGHEIPGLSVDQEEETD